MHHFVITAAAITGNKGTQSMFAAIYEHYSTRYPNSKFYLISYYPEFDRQFERRFKNLKVLSGTPMRLLLFTTPLAIIYTLFKFLNIPFRLHKVDPVLNAFAQSSLVMDMGGITFSDGREIYLPFNIITVLPAVLFKLRIVKLAQAIGPFKNRLNRFSAKLILPRLTHIFARGEMTYAYLQSLGMKNISLSSDASFLLNLNPKSLTGIESHIPKTGNSVVGISPSSVILKKCKKAGIDYPTVMSEFITLLTGQYGCDVLLIPHSIRFHTDKLKNNDLPVAKAIAGRVKNNQNVFMLSDDLTAIELRALIGKCNYFVGSRYHSMISALAQKVPLVVCGWGHKYFETLDQFDLRQYSIDYRELSPGSLLFKFEQMLKNEQRIRQTLDRKLPGVKALSAVQFDVSSQYLN